MAGTQSTQPAPHAAPEGVEDLETSVAFLIGAIANKLVASGSRILRARFGIGFGEWRVLVMIALEPGVPARRICDVVGMDKAAVSRGVKALLARGLIAPRRGTPTVRLRGYELTRKGKAVRRAMVPLFEETSEILLARLAPGERPVLIDALRRMLGQIPEVETYSERAAAGGELE